VSSYTPARPERWRAVRDTAQPREPARGAEGQVGVRRIPERTADREGVDDDEGGGRVLVRERRHVDAEVLEEAPPARADRDVAPDDQLPHGRPPCGRAPVDDHAVLAGGVHEVGEAHGPLPTDQARRRVTRGERRSGADLVAIGELRADDVSAEGREQPRPGHRQLVGEIDHAHASERRAEVIGVGHGHPHTL
jgi:hypothetical protein